MASRVSRLNRRGISNVVATIILIAVAIALAVAVAVWVFSLSGSASKTATLTVQAVGLSGLGKGTANLVLLISNPSSSGIGLNGFTLGSLSCVFSAPVQVPAGTQGGQLTISIPVSNGYFGTSNVGVTGSGGVSVPSTISVSCSGNQTAQVGIQYSGYITTVSGQTYPFTVAASS
jgi:flagellin-like protein